MGTGNERGKGEGRHVAGAGDDTLKPVDNPEF